jgi:hypothetical protein
LDTPPLCLSPMTPGARGEIRNHNCRFLIVFCSFVFETSSYSQASGLGLRLEVIDLQ